MKARTGLSLATFAVAVLIAIALFIIFRPRLPKAVLRSRSGMPMVCRDVQFEDIHHIVCTIDLDSYAVTLHLDADDGKPFGSVVKFDKAMVDRHRPVLLAMNAGMYHRDMSPVGLYVEGGKEISPLNESNGKGNFFIKPNGVFLVDKNREASIVKTETYAASHPDPLYATQSGPLLVIDGKVNPIFEDNGQSRFIRNGVGIVDSHTIVLAISRSPVSFGSFARLFKDKLGCANALYFDGQVSTLTNGREPLIGGNYPAGPILSIGNKP